MLSTVGVILSNPSPRISKRLGAPRSREALCALLGTVDRGGLARRRPRTERPARPAAGVTPTARRCRDPHITQAALRASQLSQTRERLPLTVSLTVRGADRGWDQSCEGKTPGPARATRAGKSEPNCTAWRRPAVVLGDVGLGSFILGGVIGTLTPWLVAVVAQAQGRAQANADAGAGQDGACGEPKRREAMIRGVWKPTDRRAWC